MTVFVYVNTSKQVGDAEHVKVFATTPRKNVSRKTIPKDCPQDRLRNAWILVLTVVWQVLGSR
jgi:hypothetical protein